MRRNIAGAALCALLVAGSCTSSEQTDRALPGTAPEPVITTRPTRCRGLGRPAEQITVASGDRLVAIDLARDSARCLAPLDSAGTLAWGGRGDRVTALGPDGDEVLTPASTQALARVSPDDEFLGLSRPTGTSAVFVSADGSRLSKVPLAGGAVEDVTFLDRHDDAVYHPAGTHLAVTGHMGATYGLYVVKNTGEDPQLLARGEQARRIDELAFSHDGRRLYFAADHTGEFHLHALQLASGDRTGDVGRDVAQISLETLTVFTKPISDITVSEFSRAPLLAYSEGRCGDSNLHVSGADASSYDVASLDAGEARPVGWLEDGSLAVAAYDDCDDDEFDLFVVTPERTRLLIPNVRGAAVRAVLPPPPDPPARATEVVA